MILDKNSERITNNIFTEVYGLIDSLSIQHTPEWNRVYDIVNELVIEKQDMKRNSEFSMDAWGRLQLFAHEQVIPLDPVFFTSIPIDQAIITYCNLLRNN